jgi:16S rRNA (cytidine1402-2'-O)-methyltransferase
MVPGSDRINLVGTLYLVATPIGNLEDITLRALRVLREASLIAAEDTRHSGVLLSHYEIKTPSISYYEHNKLAREDEILAALQNGDVALVSDAGTPALSDPGYELVRSALRAGHDVSPIPGPAAPVAALVASGLAPDAFSFVGYLPRKSKARRALIDALATRRETIIAFEAPHRLHEALIDLTEILGEDRQVALCRELTKSHEQIIRAPLGALRAAGADIPPRGEITLVIAGAPEPGPWSREEVLQALEKQLSSGKSPSQAARAVAQQSGWHRRDVYKLTLEE